MNHMDLVCKYGYSHGGCKCGSRDKEVRLTECNFPEHVNNPKIAVQDGTIDAVEKLKAAIDEFAGAVGMVPKAESVDEYLLLAHEATVKAKRDSDSARAALWGDTGRRC